jgi:formamidopyrimidine-DNA glycosylase
MSEGPQVRIKTEWLRKNLVGRDVVSCLTSRERLRAFAVTGHRVRNVFCKGKHIFLEFDDELFLHNHLLMRESWRRLEGRLLLLSPGTWLALDMGSHTVCNLNGQMLRAETSESVAQELSRLGPDVMADPYPADEIGRALRSRKPGTVRECRDKPAWRSGCKSHTRKV